MGRAKIKANLVKPMAHQLVSLKHDKTTDVIYDASDAGTGKTLVRVMSFAERRRKGGGCALVLAPRSLLKSAWFNDFRKFAPDMRVSVANADNREKAFDADADVYVTNHDAVKWLVKQPKSFFDRFINGDFIGDEMTAYKHHSSQRSKAAAKVAHGVDFKKRVGMSATPTALTILDIWHQMYVLDRGKLLGHSFYKFRDTVCKPVQVGRSVHAVQWQDKPGSEEAVFGILQDVVIRHKFEECVDIPKTHTYDIEYEVPKKVRAAYEQMEMSQLLMLRGGSKKGTVTALSAVNAAAVATKLMQILSGAVYDSNDKYHVIDTERYDLVLDLIEQRKHSLVFFQWKHQRDMLEELATKRGITFCTLDGAANDRQREAMVAQYQAGHFQVMFAHPRSAAHGLTLTKGTATIWPNPIYDLELWQQGNKRQARIGQKEKTEVIVVLAKDTIEERVYKLLMDKNTRMQNLLDLFEDMARDYAK